MNKIEETFTKRCFSIAILVMGFMGFYPPDKPSFLYLMRTYVAYFSLTVVVVVLGMVRIVTVESDGDFIQQNYTWIYTVEVFCCGLKSLLFLLNGQRYKKCIAFFDHPRFAPQDEVEKEMMDYCAEVCRKNCQFYLVQVTVSVTMWMIPSLISKGTLLPLEIWLPFDPYANLHNYYPALAYTFASSLYSGFSSTMFDPMIGTLSYHATTRLRILKYNLEDLIKFVDTPVNQKEDSTIKLENAYKVLKHCVQHHNDILNFVEEFEHCFSWFIFFQSAGSTLTVCCVCVGLTMMKTVNFDTFKHLALFVVISFQIFYYCFFGTLLTVENSNIMDAICSGPWHRYDPKIRQMLLILMEQSKRPVIITAGKVVTLTLETFTGLLKTSYSLIAIMKRFR